MPSARPGTSAAALTPSARTGTGAAAGNEDTTQRDPSSCPVVEGLAREGDVVAYRLLEIGASMCPEVSFSVCLGTV
jgi:hypothetical protein